MASLRKILEPLLPVLAVTEDSVDLGVTDVTVDSLLSSPNRDLLPGTVPTVVEGLLVDPILVITGLVEDESIPETFTGVTSFSGCTVGLVVV